VPQRFGNAHANIVPYQVFRAADRDFIIACGNDSQFIALCQSIGLPHLPDDPRFRRNADRVAHRGELVELLSAHFLGRTADEWVSCIHAAKVPVGAINSIAQSLEEPQVIARNLMVKIPHPQNPDFAMVGSPIKMSGTPVEYLRPAPMLGQHTDEVLAGRLGLSNEQLGLLKSSGVIEQLP